MPHQRLGLAFYEDLVEGKLFPGRAEESTSGSVVSCRELGSQARQPTSAPLRDQKL